MFIYCREQSEQDLIEEIHRADVICIVYAVDEPNTLAQVWIMLL